MRTRVVGNESSPGSSSASGQRNPGLKPAVAEEHTGAAPVRASEQQLSLGISEYCDAFQAPSHAERKMTCLFDPDGQGKYFSESWLEFRGSTAERERGAGWTEGVHPADLDRCMTSFLRAFDNREPFHLEFRVRRADGSYAWVLAEGVPQYFLDGSFGGYFGSLEETSREDPEVHREHRGVEASQSARQALGQTGASLKELTPPVLARGRSKRRKERRAIPRKALLEWLDFSVTPMVVVDKNRRAIYCNIAFRTLVANTLPIARTEGVLKVTHWPEDVGQSSLAREHSIPSMDLADVQGWLDSDSIANEDIRVSAQRLNAAGEVLTAFSISDARQEKRTRLLERVFLHDIVNTAGGIQMLVDLLTEDTSREEWAEHVKMLQVSIHRLLSEISHEKMMLESSGPVVSVFNVHKVLENLAEHYRNSSLARNCRIEIDKGVNESIQLLSDQTLFVRAIDHMLRSAIEASRHGGVVTLGCRQIDSQLEFWVHNSNPISENVRTKIFTQAFSTNQRVGNAGTQDAQLLSEPCGGTMRVSSDKESGTTFSVRYPAAVETVSSQKRYRTKTAS
jgi:PAS domain S-box-containing protein